MSTSTCAMTHTPPMDFAQCETHDTTFALGDVCKFHEKDPLDVLQDEADEQRGLKVRAEMELERLRQHVAVFLAMHGGGIAPIWHRALSEVAGDDEPTLEQAHEWLGAYERQAQS